VSRDNLPNIENPQVTIQGNTLHYSWTDNTGTGIASADDRTILVTYSAAENLATYIIGGATSNTGSDILT
jgi:hypothetical protein